MNQFNEIATEYTKARALIVRDILDNTFHGVLGDVSGKTILDLGCGNGFYTRRLKEAGASQVVGVDVAEAMIKIAKADEEDNPLGIEYILTDVEKIGVIDEFDCVTSSLLFNSVSTKENIMKICEVAYNNLKLGGRFITANVNNKLNLTHFENNGYQKYGLATKIVSPLPDGGTIVEATVYVGQQQFSFNSYLLTFELYQSAHEKAGFKNLSWHDKMVISPALKQEYGDEYWDYFLQNPAYAVMACEK